MNRLILIGNGFDLAHGLKSSYSDFIKWYISDAINSFGTNNFYVDPLLEIRFKSQNQILRGFETSFPHNSLQTLEKIDRDRIKVSVKSDFLVTAIEKVSKINWVDLEDSYFNILLSCRYASGFDYDRVKEINGQFDFLKQKLESYLAVEQESVTIPLSEELLNIFCEPFRGKDMVESIEDPNPHRNLILNFNYTNTLQKYQEECNKKVPTEINHIHGELKMKTNPIVFGFGDEYNKSYLEFEDLHNNDLLTHIKSFGYFKASNYHNLLRFIENDIFQVFIFGHSLGLSDRTMLRQIFEHEHCKSIKIFFHQKDENKNDFTDKTYDISSHFLDKASMRKKIVPLDLSSAMPQPGIK